MNHQRHIALGMIALFAVLSVACKTTAEKETADAGKAKTNAEKQERKRQAELEKIRGLKDGEIFIVGRIEVVPKIRKEEQDLRTGGSGRLANKVHAYYTDKFVNITEDSFSIMKAIAEIPLEEDFVIKRKKSEALYYSGGNVWLESSASHSGYMNKNTTINIGKLRLPGDMVYKLRPGDQAVYVGTIRYNRDTYNAITKVTYVNDYARANAKFQGIVKNPAIKLRVEPPKKQKGVW
jgi:hypothetical protein